MMQVVRNAGTETFTCEHGRLTCPKSHTSPTVKIFLTCFDEHEKLARLVCILQTQQLYEGLMWLCFAQTSVQVLFGSLAGNIIFSFGRGVQAQSRLNDC